MIRESVVSKPASLPPLIKGANPLLPSDSENFIGTSTGQLLFPLSGVPFRLISHCLDAVVWPPRMLTPPVKFARLAPNGGVS